MCFRHGLAASMLSHFDLPNPPRRLLSQMRLPLKDGRRGVHSYGAMDEGTRTPSDGGIPAYPVSP
jgi:hypothetical protein